jgi:hypothetical protein
MTQNNEINKIFDNWLTGLTVKEYPIIKGKLYTQCDCNKTILYNWRKGITPIPKYLRKEINLIAGKKLFKIEEN